MPLEPRGVIEERARAAIEFPAEFAGVEFKANLPFDHLKYRIAKTSMAMANLRDGGLIIVGIAQDSSRNFVIEGIDAANALTFVQETVYEFVNLFASPTVELRVATTEVECRSFLVVAIPPFERTPVVCRRNTPDGTKKADQMHEGDFFVRTNAPVGTERVKSAAMMADLLELAVGRRLAEQDRLRPEAGATEAQSSVSRFDEEVEDIADAF